jgi:hypothetical protein
MQRDAPANIMKKLLSPSGEYENQNWTPEQEIAQIA